MRAIGIIGRTVFNEVLSYGRIIFNNIKYKMID